MSVTRELQDGVAVLRVQGSMMGGPETMAMHDEIKRAIEEGVRSFLIDLERVTHLSSLGLGCLIACLVTAQRGGGAVKLLKPGKRIHELLRVTDVLRHFPCFTDETRALASFR
jgi:anti-sigma B factor antagonist